MHDMTVEIMFHVATGAEMFDQYAIAAAYDEYARTAVTAKEEGYYTRKALRARTKGVVAYDREMDRLMKEYPRKV